MADEKKPERTPEQDRRVKEQLDAVLEQTYRRALEAWLAGVPIKPPSYKN